ncbi:MAG: decaprenylphospho-beta-D-erythro-pentofuranosid-2-ulose 2-reductase [Ilumatobacteraceae bacterium]
MRNAHHEPQTVLLLGGTSEIGRAIARRLVAPATKTIVLGCREPDAAPDDRFGGAHVDVRRFDAADVSSHESFVRAVVEEHGDIDIAIVAFGLLGNQDELIADPRLAAELVHVNYTGAVSISLAVAAVMKRQGHGRLVLLSSVAGERARATNFVYGSSKAGLDAFGQGLADSLVGTGVGVTVVRPGFVRSRMTAHLPDVPFATTPEAVADATVAGVRAGRHTVWAPGILRPIFSVLRHLPRSVFRRLPLG